MEAKEGSSDSARPKKFEDVESNSALFSALGILIIAHLSRMAQFALYIVLHYNHAMLVTIRKRHPLLQHLHPPRLRQKHTQRRRHKHASARHIQHARPAARIHLPRNKRGHDARQAAPEAREARRAAAHAGRERLGRPAVQHRVERRLEEVLHRVEAGGGRGRRDRAVEEEGDAHERGGEDHDPFAPEEGELDERGAEDDAGHARDGDKNAEESVSMRLEPIRPGQTH